MLIKMSYVRVGTLGVGVCVFLCVYMCVCVCVCGGGELSYSLFNMSSTATATAQSKCPRSDVEAKLMPLTAPSVPKEVRFWPTLVSIIDEVLQE